MRKQRLSIWNRESALRIVCALFCLLLAGCGTESAPDPRSGVSAPAATGAVDSAEPAGAVEVSFWFAANATGASVMRQIVEDFNRSQEQYHVNLTVFGSYSEIYSEVQAGIATGTAPDLALLERDASIDLHSKGLTVDLTRVLRRDARFSPDRFLSVYFDQGIGADGSIFAMPLYGTTQVLFYNREAFRAAGIAPESVRTWQDLAAAAAVIRDTGAYDYGWEPMWGYENMMDAVLSNGGTLFSPDGRTVTINSPEWVSVWETFRKWLHEDKIMRIHSGGYGWEYWTHTMEDVLEGRAGGYTGSSGDQADVDFSVVGMLEQPAWSVEGTACPSALALLLNVLSTSDADRQSGAYALIRWLIDVPAQVRWATGTGYIAVNRDILSDPQYLSWLDGHEYAEVPITQSIHASVDPYDPTGGVVREVLVRAADRVQIENLPAQEVLDEAQRTAQKALDAALAAAEPADGEAAA